MPIRLRKLFGTIALLALAASWALGGMALAQFPAIANLGAWAFAYYVVVGIGWVLPAMPIVRWMLTPDRNP